MKIFRWMLLIGDVIVLLLLVIGFAAMIRVGELRTQTAGFVGAVAFTAMVLVNIIFIVITWRYDWSNGRKGIGKMTRVFE